MILSNKEIIKALDKGTIVINPRPDESLMCKDNDLFGSMSLDLRLGSTILIPKQGQSFAFDLKAGSISEFLKIVCDKVDISGDRPYVLNNNKFILANTLEKIGLPIIEGNPCYAARVEGKSSFARCGLIVHFTAPTIHAGFKGTITLEMINLSANSIILHAGMPICQLIFERVEGEILQHTPSRFMGQSSPEGLA